MNNDFETFFETVTNAPMNAQQLRWWQVIQSNEGRHLFVADLREGKSTFVIALAGYYAAVHYPRVINLLSNRFLHAKNLAQGLRGHIYFRKSYLNIDKLDNIIPRSVEQAYIIPNSEMIIVDDPDYSYYTEERAARTCAVLNDLSARRLLVFSKSGPVAAMLKEDPQWTTWPSINVPNDPSTLA